MSRVFAAVTNMQFMNGSRYPVCISIKYGNYFLKNKFWHFWDLINCKVPMHKTVPVVNYFKNLAYYVTV